MVVSFLPVGPDRLRRRRLFSNPFAGAVRVEDDLYLLASVTVGNYGNRESRLLGTGLAAPTACSRIGVLPIVCPACLMAKLMMCMISSFALVTSGAGGDLAAVEAEFAVDQLIHEAGAVKRT